MENVRGCHSIGSVQTAVAAATTKARTPAAIVTAIAKERAAIVADSTPPAAHDSQKRAAIGAAIAKKRALIVTRERAQKHPIGLGPPTAVAASKLKPTPPAGPPPAHLQTAGTVAASMTASEAAGDVRLMQWMNPPESGALTYASGASEEQRKENKKAMEERRDILVAAIEEHDDYMIAMLSVDCSKRGVKVCIPIPMVMEDRSCGKTIEQDKRYVRKHVQWLNPQK